MSQIESSFENIANAIRMAEHTMEQEHQDLQH